MERSTYPKSFFNYLSVPGLCCWSRSSVGLIMRMSDPSTAVKVEGIHYFADTLLFAGAILALASAKPRDSN
jgi:hypothetical protein